MHTFFSGSVSFLQPHSFFWERAPFPLRRMVCRRFLPSSRWGTHHLKLSQVEEFLPTWKGAWVISSGLFTLRWARMCACWSFLPKAVQQSLYFKKKFNFLLIVFWGGLCLGATVHMWMPGDSTVELVLSGSECCHPACVVSVFTCWAISSPLPSLPSPNTLTNTVPYLPLPHPLPPQFLKPMLSLNLWSCLHLQNARIAGMHYHTQFCAVLGLEPGLCALLGKHFTDWAISLDH